ncbi:MAG: DNA-processing protein DprA [Muribaculaceae bacterium]|nr:DNA-processing protein DprA [Muribaculaceae bacterium]
MMNDAGNSTLHDIAFASLRGMNLAIARQMAEIAPGVDAQRFFSMDERELERAFGIKTAVFSSQSRRKALDEASREMEWVTKHGIECIAWTSARYPQRLLECEDAPLMLYGRGNTDLDSQAVISIVGTRRATVYGTSFVERTVAELVEKLPTAPVVVSGLALGIDIAAHRAALNAGCPTVAVMATGLNSIYPAVHRTEARRIIDNGGMVLTEYRSIDAIHRGNFLARNRIVAGLADVTLLAESAEKGGAITTARLAAEYDRHVAALPGRASDRYSRGCNKLIADARAALVQDSDDIIALAGWPTRQKPSMPVQQTLFPELDENETRVVELIRTHGELHQNELAALLSLPFHVLAATLMDLEFKRIVAQIPGGRYMLV